jgi:xylulokinase
MYALGIDLGTNSVKSLVVELETGRIAGTGQRGYGYIEGTEAEQDRELVWNMVVQSVRVAVAQASLPVSDASLIKAVGLSGQMHGTVLYDQTGECVGNIITWEDSRCGRDVLDEIAKIGGEDVQRSGCGVATGFLGPTVYYIARQSDIKIGHVLLPTDWLRQELTGERTFLTDHSNGSSTGFFNTQDRDWNYSLIEKLGLPEDIFPEVASTRALDGGISRSTAEATGLTAGTPVTVGGGDQPLSMIGSGICEPSDGILLNIGTGSQVSRVGEYAKEEGTIVFCFPEHGYSLLGAALSGGAALKWWRTASVEHAASLLEVDFPEGNIYQRMDQWAAEISPGADGLTFIPYLSGTRVQPGLKASFTGLTRHHSYAHFTRAILEGVVFELYYLYERLAPCPDDDTPIIAAGGGFSSRLWTQIAADIFGREIKATQCQEQAALGAALIAGVGLGYYSGMREACGKVKYRAESVRPKKENLGRYREVYEARYKKYLSHAP